MTSMLVMTRLPLMYSVTATGGQAGNAGRIDPGADLQEEEDVADATFLAGCYEPRVVEEMGR
ncbi:hypothetical protein [Streptacidiphilus sp. PAMC 29251]